MIRVENIADNFFSKMSSKSNISTTLSERRRKHFLLKLLMFLFLFLIIIISLIFITHYDGIKIKEIDVEGNSTIEKQGILDLVNEKMSKKLWFFINRDNILFLPRANITYSIQDNFKKVEKVSIEWGGIKKININIIERVEKALWCDGLISDSKKCFFIDSTGYVFGEAPAFLGNPFPKYYGILTENPIGKYYFSDGQFLKIFEFFEGVKSLNFNPESLNAINSHEYEILLADGGIININDKQVFSESLKRLNALIENGYIKTDKTSLEKIKHIDLCYGNKVYYDFR